MKNISFATSGVCAREIEFTIDDEGRIRDLSFYGGCNGNLKAIGKLCEGQKAEEIATLLEGNRCGFKSTSCADQLAKAIRENL